MTPVKSESIAAVGYDPTAKRMTVQFKNGGSYHYDDVTPDQHSKLLGADSVGAHFQQNIRGKFKATKAK